MAKQKKEKHPIGRKKNCVSRKNKREQKPTERERPPGALLKGTCITQTGALKERGNQKTRRSDVISKKKGYEQRRKRHAKKREK